MIFNRAKIGTSEQYLIKSRVKLEELRSAVNRIKVPKGYERVAIFNDAKARINAVANDTNKLINSFKAVVNRIEQAENNNQKIVNDIEPSRAGGGRGNNARRNYQLLKSPLTMPGKYRNLYLSDDEQEDLNRVGLNNIKGKVKKGKKTPAGAFVDLPYNFSEDCPRRRNNFLQWNADLSSV